MTNKELKDAFAFIFNVAITNLDKVIDMEQYFNSDSQEEEEEKNIETREKVNKMFEKVMDYFNSKE